METTDDDPYLWLEDLDSDEAARWVTERNAETLAAFADEAFARTRDAIREVLDSKDRIPYPTRRGDGFYYDFWQDADHPRGLWRRTTAQEYRRDEPAWDVLLDVNALNAAEGENWVWAGASVRRPDHGRCLVSLSRGGADAVVVREFDLRERVFVADGFTLPEAKSDVDWIDADHLFVSTDFGPGSLTSAGYPRIVKRWRRGTPLAEAEVVFEGEVGDVSVGAGHDPTPGYERDWVCRYLDFYRSELYLLVDGRPVKLDVPDDAGCEAYREWLLVRPRTPWTVGGRTYPAGALLASRLEPFLDGRRDLAVLFAPDARTSLGSWSWTRHHLILTTSVDVRTRLHVLTPDASGWRRRTLPTGAGDLDDAGIVDVDPDTDDSYLIATDGFLRPATLGLGTVDGPVETLKRAPAFFDAAGMAVRQYFATSADGTRVPYFVVGPETVQGGPALLYGYGGFEHSLGPGYSGVIGRAWLARGGTYAVANIRGGGEYGPAWHHAARREGRVKAFEDFAAVARDLVARGVTAPERLGIEGDSNGGLLMGAMLTRYPELFGAVAASVPLLDMRRYTKLLAGASWTAEYGDPDDEADWAYLRAYSPYHNVAPGRPYPPVLFITSTRDDRVHPGHARKMVALLRRHGYPAAYYENVEGGHGAAADNEQAATVRALTLEFLWRALQPAPD